MFKVAKYFGIVLYCASLSVMVIAISRAVDDRYKDTETSALRKLNPPLGYSYGVGNDDGFVVHLTFNAIAFHQSKVLPAPASIRLREGDLCLVHKFTRLNSLDLEFTNIDDNSIRHLRHPVITELNIANTNMSLTGILELKLLMPRIRRLTVSISGTAEFEAIMRANLSLEKLIVVVNESEWKSIIESRDALALGSLQVFVVKTNDHQRFDHGT